jgi:ParB family chromosome partitioning protein
VNRKPAAVNDPSYTIPAVYSCIPLDRIDLTDGTYRITTTTVGDDLIASIGLAGLIHFPIVKPAGRVWIMVSGFRRLEACRRLGWTRIPAWVLNDGVDERTCVRLAIADKQGQRPLNMVELARAVGLLERLADNTTLVERAAAAGLNAGMEYLKKADRIRALPWSIQEGLLGEAIALPIALELGRLARVDALALADVFKTLRCSLNRQREILTLMQEIAARHGVGLSMLSADAAVTAILNQPDRDHRQKTEALRRCLRQLRYPWLSSAENRFAKAVRSLGLGPGVELSAPPHFEAKTYTLTLRFENPSQLAERSMSLQQLLSHPDLPAVFERGV